MSILWMDDFKTYGTGSAGNNIVNDGTAWSLGSYLNASIQVDPDPGAPADSRYLQVTSGGASPRLFARRPHTVMGFAGRLWMGSLSTNRSIITNYFGSSATPYYTLVVEFNGAMSWYRGELAELLATTAEPLIAASQWTHIESRVDTITGDIEVRREGIPVPELTLEGAYAPALPIYGIQMSRHSLSSTGGSGHKDVVLWNGEGAVNNDFIGPCAVYRLPVDEDVSSGWSRSAGTSDYELLDEVPPDDAQFIYAGEDPFPAPSIMKFGDLPEEVVAVRGVQTMVRARKTDGGDGSLQVSLSPNDGLDWADGVDRAITTAFTYWTDISETSPDTAGAWLPGEVNNAEIRIDRTV